MECRQVLPRSTRKIPMGLIVNVVLLQDMVKLLPGSPSGSHLSEAVIQMEHSRDDE